MTAIEERALPLPAVREPAPGDRSRGASAFSGKFWIGIAVSVVFLYLALRGQDFGLLWRALREASYVWLIPALLCYFVGVAIRAFSWHILLRSTKPIPTRRLWPVVVIGY